MNTNPLNDFAQKLGPGLITGAADDDPSGIATYSQAGSHEEQFPEVKWRLGRTVWQALHYGRDPNHKAICVERATVEE